MKKRVIHNLLTMLLLMVIAMNASAQRADLRAMSGDIFYWFNVKISNSIDRDTKLEAYALRVISPTIYNGKVNFVAAVLSQIVQLHTSVVHTPQKFYGYGIF
jgi:hypothetical protein